MFLIAPSLAAFSKSEGLKLIGRAVWYWSMESCSSGARQSVSFIHLCAAATHQRVYEETPVFSVGAGHRERQSQLPKCGKSLQWPLGPVQGLTGCQLELIARTVAVCLTHSELPCNQGSGTLGARSSSVQRSGVSAARGQTLPAASGDQPAFGGLA